MGTESYGSLRGDRHRPTGESRVALVIGDFGFLYFGRTFGEIFIVINREEERMKKMFVIVSVAFLLLVFGTFTNSYAIPITMEFTASDFASFNEVEAPDDQVSGTFTWEAASVNATIPIPTAIRILLMSLVARAIRLPVFV